MKTVRRTTDDRAREQGELPPSDFTLAEKALLNSFKSIGLKHQSAVYQVTDLRPKPKGQRV